MTTPMERSRALRFAHEVLTLVSTRQEVPQDLRHQALVALRHLPRPHEIASLATHKALNWWIEPEPPSKAMNASIEDLPLPQAYSPTRLVWTIWLEYPSDNEMVSTFVAVVHAIDEGMARVMFACRFGVGYAQLAQTARGIVANEITEAMISQQAIETMTILEHLRQDFSLYSRMDRATSLKRGAH